MSSLLRQSRSGNQIRILFLSCTFGFSVVIQAQIFHLPEESAGIDSIARTLISVFDHFDIVALGEAHDRKVDSDLRIALVRHPDFAKKVRVILVEFGSTTEHPI